MIDYSIARRLSFKFVPAEDGSVDDVHEVFLDGKPTPYGIQVCMGRHVVYETGYSTPGDDSTMWIAFHGNELGYKRIGEAKDLILELIAKSL